MTPEEHRLRAADIAAAEQALTFRRVDFEQAWKIGRRLVALGAGRPLAIWVAPACRSALAGR